MILETELKLLIDSDDIPKFIKHPLLRQYLHGVSKRQYVRSYYFDTQDERLLKNGLVLRIREINGLQHLQTIKNTTQSQNGLHQRQEWNQEVQNLTPDLTVIPNPSLRAQLEESEALTIIFTTEFERTTWNLYFSNDAIVEVALDIGKVCAGDQCEPIQEVELELKQGQVDKLYEISTILRRDLNLIPSDQSKAERGYRLKT